MTILDEIFAYKREFVAAAKRATPIEEVRTAAEGAGRGRGFAAELRGTRDERGGRTEQTTMRVVAEIKKASPSRGLIREDFDPASIAKSYESGGAAAISVLTDEKFFQGSLEYLRQARGATSRPILRKEFMIDAFQVYEARAAGADAILLIAGLIEWPELKELRELAREVGLDVLLEVHDATELGPALDLAPDVLGINNRDLRTSDFHTDLATTEKLLAQVPAEVTLMSESGIRNADDVERLAHAGVDAILVGEHLMREPDPGAAIKSKLGIRAPSDTGVS